MAAASRALASAGCADVLNAIAESIADGGWRLRVTGGGLGWPGISHLLALVGFAVWLIGQALLYILAPLTWLRDALQSSANPVWYDFALTAVVVSALLSTA